MSFACQMFPFVSRSKVGKTLIKEGAAGTGAGLRGNPVCLSSGFGKHVPSPKRKAERPGGVHQRAHFSA